MAGGTKIQSLIFDKDEFNKSDAIHWAKKHDFKALVDEKSNTYRIRQISPDKFKAESFRTTDFGGKLPKGIKAVIAKPITSKMENGGHTDSLEGKSLSQIANIIRNDWKNPYFGAKPYLDAMSTLNSMDDMYGMDSGKSIVAYFLGNASTWRGETAKKVKAHLNKLLKNSRYEQGGDVYKTGGTLGEYYDLRLPLGSGLSENDAINNAIRDAFLENDGVLDKKRFDHTIKALSKRIKAYDIQWKKFKETFEIVESKGRYINPYTPNSPLYKRGGIIGFFSQKITLTELFTK